MAKKMQQLGPPSSLPCAPYLLTKSYCSGRLLVGCCIPPSKGSHWNVWPRRTLYFHCYSHSICQPKRWVNVLLHAFRPVPSPLKRPPTAKTIVWLMVTSTHRIATTQDRCSIHLAVAKISPYFSNQWKSTLTLLFQNKPSTPGIAYDAMSKLVAIEWAQGCGGRGHGGGCPRCGKKIPLFFNQWKSKLTYLFWANRAHTTSEMMGQAGPNQWIGRWRGMGGGRGHGGHAEVMMIMCVAWSQSIGFSLLFFLRTRQPDHSYL